MALLYSPTTVHNHNEVKSLQYTYAERNKLISNGGAFRPGDETFLPPVRHLDPGETSYTPHFGLHEGGTEGASFVPPVLGSAGNLPRNGN